MVKGVLNVLHYAENYLQQLCAGPHWRSTLTLKGNNLSYSPRQRLCVALGHAARQFPEAVCAKRIIWIGSNSPQGEIGVRS
jgi:hypothetical protein